MCGECLNNFATGINELDSLIGEGLTPDTMLLVAGNPGAGKTTLASQICYANAKAGRKCLYIILQEHKEKLFRHMARLGIDLGGMESRGFVRLVKLPIGGADELLNILSDVLIKDSYEVVVLDSVNALLTLARPEERRALLQNFFHMLANLTNGLVVAVAEIPLDRKSPRLGSIDFIADVILYLKHRVTRGLLTRVIEIKKVRGAPLSNVEMPFSIREGEGISIYAPPKLERLTRAGEEPLNFSLSVNRQLLGNFSRGSALLVEHSPKASSPIVVLLLTDVVLSSKIRALLVIHKYSEEDVREVITKVMATQVGLSKEETNRLIDKYVKIKAINPTSEAPQTITIREFKLVESYGSGMVIRLGTELLDEVANPRECRVSYINSLAWFKSKGVTTIEIVETADRFPNSLTEFKQSLADAITDVDYTFREGEGKYIPIVTSSVRGRVPVRIELDDEVMEVARAELRALLSGTT